MAVTSANYTTIVTNCRAALAKGLPLYGPDIRLIIDVVQHAANTLDSKGVAEVAVVSTDVTALSAALVTALAAWTAVGAGDSSAVYTTQEAILTPLRTAAVASIAAAVTADAAGITNITASDALDGRSA